MFTTALIAFREFLEAFLIVGIFLGISRKLGLKKEVEIILAAAIGIALSFLLSAATYLFGDQARTILTEENADFLESYLLIFSGFFIAYVVFSLHDVISHNKHEMIKRAQTKLQHNAFDVSLFLLIIFMVVREGFEIALFTGSTSIFATFMQNILGLFIGFAVSSAIGITAFLAYIKFPIRKVFRVTEYMIILVGASLVQVGITKFLSIQFAFSLSKIFSLPLGFLPNEDTAIGHMLQSLLGIDREFSVMRLGIMVVYIVAMYVLFIRKRQKQIGIKT
jgi:high-affinity iron transporter